MSSFDRGVSAMRQSAIRAVDSHILTMRYPCSEQLQYELKNVLESVTVEKEEVLAVGTQHTLTEFERGAEAMREKLALQIAQFLSVRRYTFVDAIRSEVSGIINSTATPEMEEIEPQTPERPSWDEYFLRFAEVAAQRSTCPKRSVGCVLVYRNRIIATGYNGAPSGLKHCTEVGCQEIRGGCGRAIHAEQNALLHSANLWLGGSTCYSTAHPCSHCARMLIAAGIRRVVYSNNGAEYEDEQARALFAEAEVEVEKL